MDTVSTETLQTALMEIASAIVGSEPLLTEIDTIIGDGDHGTGMRDGFSALGQMLAAETFPDAFALFRASGLTLVKTMGGASGVIFGTLFTAGHAVVRDKKELNAQDLTDFFDEGARAIMRRGRSGPGDKTMLDALLPAIEAMGEKQKSTPDVAQVVAAGYQGALAGVENTKNMLPRTGRSKNFREKALGWPDPGAVSVSIIFGAFANSLSNSK